MQQITKIGQYRLAFTTFINERGDIKWVARNDKGAQTSEVRLLHKHACQRSGYIALPVFDAKGRLKTTYFDWCDIYREHYLGRPLPSILQSIDETRQQPRHHKPCPQTQLSLLDTL